MDGAGSYTIIPEDLKVELVVSKAVAGQNPNAVVNMTEIRIMAQSFVFFNFSLLGYASLLLI
jgi:hypothetical protein